MEGRKQSGSSFTSDLFGSKESPGSSSSGVFGSIFSPKPTGREFLYSESIERKEDSASQVWNIKRGVPDNNRHSREDDGQSTQNRDMSSYYPEQKVQPCHLSSSIYYGGQDIYTQPQDTKSSVYTTLNKDGEEDDSGSASRGNWWKGSLYY